ncbi:5'-nucleotidase C-terminal domain-containing protein [uncultured Sphaerochaeta sp.]|uniref:5'-nucleotidase C-terminal domain-containing protein n=1 Tax=uncultured Sphaerochaeta sp. TaxID=886478 RepID=UPI002A0A3D25|nr:5'-nucleotidase C-terminal domain-containing protein [uncultured Sphaerochaeta sp.]
MKRNIALLFILSLCMIAFPLFATGQNEVTVTILETSDMHGTFAPWDYATDSPLDQGWAKVATVIKQERVKDPSLLLVDNGDTSQDNMIQEFRFDAVPPVARALNFLGYDAWELGNHEFNFEFENLQREIAAVNAPVLGGNIYKTDGTRFAQPYIIKRVNGVRVAIMGLAPPHINRWEASDPAHFDNMTFTSPMEETGKILKELEGKADVIVALIHYGEEGEYDTEGIREVAAKYGDKISAFLIGHAHSTLQEVESNGSVIVEPGSKGSGVGKVEIKLVQKVSGGKWLIEGVTGSVIPVKGQKIEADPAFLGEFKYVDDKSRAMANTAVGKVGGNFLPSLNWNDIPGIPTAIMQDTAMVDLINDIQLDATKADVSLAALFDANSDLPKGDFRKRDGVKIYKYDNTLMAVRVTGKQLKAIMELQAGSFFNQYKKGDVTISFNSKIRMYNYDMFQGVAYDIDVSKPVGQRICNVIYKGKPLSDSQVLVLALNNYRYGGLSSSGLISSKSEDLVYNSGLAIRDLISDYVVKHGTIMPSCDNNWKLIGADLSDKDAQRIYALVRDGKIMLPTSSDGRTPNIEALNANDLRMKKIL